MMTTSMTRRLAALAAAGMLGLTASCQDFLDVNTNPNAPEKVAANLYLSPMLHWMVTTGAWDGRCTSQFTQMLTQSGNSTYDIHGMNIGTDTCGEQWRTTYWIFGQNLIDMMDKAQAEQRWDILGAGYVFKAWGWLQTTNLHGEIIISGAFDQTTFEFDYDPQQVAYAETKRMLDSAIFYLEKTDGAVDAAFMGRGDKMYNGDRVKWLKFAHGLYATMLSHYSNKAAYDPQAIISHVDQSFTSNTDDALWGFPNTSNDDRNFMGPSRLNYMTYRQTRFIVGLLDGTVFGPEDPRMRRMLSAAPDSVYRGLTVGESFTALPTAQQPNNPAGYPGNSPAANSPGLYLFGDVVKYPAMTYAQLQFIKAEAAYKAGLMPVARDAYRNGISAHIDFVNERNRETGRGNVSQISAAEKAAFLANPAIVPTDPTQLTLQQIMSQKFIAQWGWGFNEAWMDMRRYHYEDVDPVTGEAIFPGWERPTTLAANNNGKLAYRLRPRHNSEYVWNEKGLEKIGGLALDYNTVIPWIITPNP